MISEQEFQKICRLSKIDIAQNKKDSFLEKFNTIFAWIDKLKEIDISGIEIKQDNPELCNSGRDDLVNKDCSRSDILQNAKNVKYNMYSVPKVIE